MSIEQPDKPSAAKGAKLSTAAIIILVLAIAGGAGFWYLDKQSRNIPKDVPVLTPDAKAYVRNLGLSNVQMKAAEAVFGQTLVEILGQITNNGDRGIEMVELNCVFYDPYSQVVLRQRVPIVKRNSGGLAPGQTRAFRLPFDEIPKSWNQSMPQLVIAQIVFR